MKEWRGNAVSIICGGFDNISQKYVEVLVCSIAQEERMRGRKGRRGDVTARGLNDEEVLENR